MTDEQAQAVRKMVRRYLDSLPADRKTASVTAITPLTVRFPGDDAGTVVSAWASGYVPTVGDTVVLERVGPDRRGSTWVAVYAIEES